MKISDNIIRVKGVVQDTVEPSSHLSTLKPHKCSVYSTNSTLCTHCTEKCKYAHKTTQIFVFLIPAEGGREDSHPPMKYRNGEMLGQSACTVPNLYGEHSAICT